MNEVSKINQYPIGGKSFDGQWYDVYNTTITNDENYSAGQVKTYNISSFLPDNINDYEVYFSGFVRTSTISGQGADLRIKSSYNSSDFYNVICAINTRTNSSRTIAGGISLPISKDNQTIIIENAGNASQITLHVEAFRRLGTNE
jgi:hypothetical protein